MNNTGIIQEVLNILDRMDGNQQLTVFDMWKILNDAMANTLVDETPDNELKDWPEIKPVETADLDASVEYLRRLNNEYKSTK